MIRKTNPALLIAFVAVAILFVAVLALSINEPEPEQPAAQCSDLDGTKIVITGAVILPEPEPGYYFYLDECKNLWYIKK